MTAYGPKAHLASAVINWAPYYIKATRDALDGTWNDRHRRGGASRKARSTSCRSPTRCRPTLKAKVEKVKAGLKDGSFVIWKGPIVDNDRQGGARRTARWPTTSALGGFNFYVKGVEGKVPGGDEEVTAAS